MKKKNSILFAISYQLLFLRTMFPALHTSQSLLVQDVCICMWVCAHRNTCLAEKQYRLEKKNGIAPDIKLPCMTEHAKFQFCSKPQRYY